MAIRLIRIFTGDDDQSHFSVGEVEWNETEVLNAIPKGERAQTDTSGGGHRWRLVDDQPWCHVYVAVSGT
jgi:hypothetical protein